MRSIQPIVLLLIFLVSPASSNVVVEGIVIDVETGEAIIGANVIIVDSDQGGSTDSEGSFKIEWEGEYPVAIRVSHIAYKTQDLEVSSTKPITIQLTPKVLKGEEITVTGRRTRSQREASTAMDVMEIEAIELQGSRDVGSALRRISSVYIDQSSSGVQTVSIRGSNANEVAVYLDGVKINSANTGVADLSQIDLYSIQRIEVLRGGSAYLFGQGNLGGVLNLSSREALENTFSVNWGEGLSFDNDLDLSLNGTAVLGPVGFGGRFSGRSRAYQGRTLTSSAFGTLSGDVNFPSGKFKGRGYFLQNALTYPSGKVASGDKQTIGSIYFLGDILQTTDWEMFIGTRGWFEVNNFFVSMNQELEDRVVSYRIGKAFRFPFLDASLQLEGEDQQFIAIRTFVKPDRNLMIISDNELSRQADGFVVTSRWINEGELALLHRFQVEVSGRFDKIKTERFQEQVSSSITSGVPEDARQEKERSQSSFINKRIGFRMEGHTDKFRYALFMGQGGNIRLPTLNDLYIKANASALDLRNAPLLPEALSATEINLEFSFMDIHTIPMLSELELKGAYFQNNYTNKIGYKEVKRSFEDPPVPYNEARADIRGFETSAFVWMLNGKLQLQATATKLNFENPLIFPEKPEFRYVLAVDWNMNWLVISYDYFKEGERFVIGKGFARLIEPRENGNLNITLQKQIRGFNLSLSYTIRNLLSRKDKSSDSDFDILFFNYYNQFRQIVTFRISL